MKGRHQVGRGQRDQMGVGGAPLSWRPGLASHAPDSTLGLSALVVLTSLWSSKTRRGKKRALEADNSQLLLQRNESTQGLASSHPSPGTGLEAAGLQPLRGITLLFPGRYPGILGLRQQRPPGLSGLLWKCRASWPGRPSSWMACPRGLTRPEPIREEKDQTTGSQPRGGGLFKNLALPAPNS